MAVICIEGDEKFSEYEDKVKSRKVNFKFSQIFLDWWQIFLDTFPNITIRPIVKESVEKMIACNTLFSGFTVFICECLKKIFVPHTCKSRFCPSCGNKYNEERAISIKNILFDHKHRHATFTMPEEIRHFFREDRSRLDILFKAVDLTVNQWFKKINFDGKHAYVAVLHTYGKALNWNPHLHLLLLEGGIKDGKIINQDFFSYPFFRKKFMYNLLKLMEEEIGTAEFKAIRIKMWNKYRKEGFYVNTPPSKFKTMFDLIKYVTRYLSRPVMAQSRILDYDGKYVTFWYQRHGDDKVVVEKIHALEFISRLIIHIPDKNMKYIRYFGAYHNSSKEAKPSAIKMFTDKTIEFLRKGNKWRQKIINDFKRDPLKCPDCGLTMVYWDSEFT